MSLPDPKAMGDLLMGLLKDKETAMRQLMHDYEMCDNNLKAISSMIEKIEETPDKINIDKLNTRYATLMRSVLSMNQKLLLLAIVYYSGTNSSTDLTTVLNKLGRGSEAMQAMFNAKINGK